MVPVPCLCMAAIKQHSEHHMGTLLKLGPGAGFFMNSLLTLGHYPLDRYRLTRAPD